MRGRHRAPAPARRRVVRPIVGAAAAVAVAAWLAAPASPHAEGSVVPVDLGPRPGGVLRLQPGSSPAFGGALPVPVMVSADEPDEPATHDNTGGDDTDTEPEDATEDPRDDEPRPGPTGDDDEDPAPAPDPGPATPPASCDGSQP